MPKIDVTSTSRVVHDPHNRALRAWFDPEQQSALKAPYDPRELAHSLLKDSADLFHWPPGLDDLEFRSVLHGKDAYSVRFRQRHRGVPVDASEVVVNMYGDGRVHSVYNNYHYDIPSDLDPKKVKFSADRAMQVVEKIAERSKHRRISEPELIIYALRRPWNKPPKGVHPPQRAEVLTRALARDADDKDAPERMPEGTYFLAWDFRVELKDPTQLWRVLVDARTGEVVSVHDLLQYASGTGRVFDPNPIVTSGDGTLRHTSAAATINAQRATVTMDRLNAADGSGNLHLDGSFVHMQEAESPTVAEPVSTTGDFQFAFDDNNFLAAMVYFHIDRFQQHVQAQLGLTNAANYSIPADPQGVGGADNSYYVPGGGTGRIAFGGGTVPVPAGNPVPDAADAMVVLHEYGHAIQDNSNPGFDNPPSGLGEGFGDFLAAVFYDDKHATPATTRGRMMSWDSEMGTGSWPGRRYDMDWLYDGTEFAGLGGEPHATGQLWCATMFELYRKLGGDSHYPWVKSAARDLIIRLHLMANFHVPASNAAVRDMAQQVEAADRNLGGWRYADRLHGKVIYDTFRRRHVPGYPALPVDVYINDGRNGGYGSLTGNDLFTERLWMENYWETQDIWVRVVQYPNDAAQQAGDPGDHVEPPVGSPAYLYVRVKNKGASASGAVTVKAFHSDPGIGLVWPDDWMPHDTPSINVPNIPAGGHVVVGPFPWTPSVVGHECVFAIVECANDRAVTQDLSSSAHVAHADLVPFDNNIAQRNLAPTMAKGKMKRGFYINNPLYEAATVKLHFESTLPKGWGYHLNVVDTESIKLAPRQRRWVEVTIDQAEGAEVTAFEQEHRLAITGSIDGKLIGGMTFYVAPPSAFPTAPGRACEKPCGEDLFCLNVPWKDCDFEGEIDVKLRFRSKR